MSRLSAILLGLALSLLVDAVPSAGAALRPDFVGILSEDSFAGDARYRAAALGHQANAGIGLTRRTFDWATIERLPGVYSFEQYDAFVAAAAMRRMRILPVLFNPPDFHSSKPPARARPGTYPPQGNDAFARFATEVARRYGRAGTFWAENPTLPIVPIRSYQIWNEPNLPVYWPSGPSPVQYAAMLRVVGGAIKAVDRSAEIVTAGVPDSQMGIKIIPFYDALYRAGGRELFDTLAVNAYAPTAVAVAQKLRDVRRLMRRRGDSAGRIWVTEFGWGDSAPGIRHPLLVGRLQGRRIAEAIRTIGALRLDLGIRGFVYYGWRDLPPYAPNFRDFWGLHTGLLSKSGAPKPALFSFQAAVRLLKARAAGPAPPNRAPGPSDAG